MVRAAVQRARGEKGEIQARGSDLRTLPLAPGSVVELRTGGGGGFGNPLERDPERVRADVRDGYVSLAAAARDYGVVLDPDTLEVVELER